MPQIQAVDSNTFEPLPAGDYTLTVETSKQTTTKNGDPMYKVRFAVEGHNKKVFANLVWNQACAGIISNFYRAMGNELKKDDPIDFEADDIIGQTVDAKLKVVTYEGTQKNEVAFYYEPKEETSATDKYIGEKPF